MPVTNVDYYLDDDYNYSDDESSSAGRKPASMGSLRRRALASERERRSAHALVDEKLRHGELTTEQAAGVFNPTFASTRHEREWILNYLGPFFEKRQIVDVLRKVKGGKEANVYCCQAHPETGLELVAAKVYRPRLFRNLRNDALYRQGRQVLDETGKVVRDDRLLHAVRKGTRRGKEVMHASWLEHEHQTLTLLHAAGADVPEPYASGLNTILMEYLGELKAPAPTLNQVRLGKAEARAVFERLLWNVELMFSLGRVHGDLSAFNVLYWEGRFVIIDFPQVVDPFVNRAARPILERDVTRLSEYFARYGIESDPMGFAADLWTRYGPEDGLLDPVEPEWQEDLDD